MRCFKFFLRGLIFLPQVPFNRDYDCWHRGARITAILIVVSLPTVLFGAGVIVGRMF